ncbi:MAG: type IV secretory system conjugative DNA transfer family protein [Oscillospiraceae bacterium]|nr:type IV secretory system conjugative DNA transfer family protein [Oscillospiraceae bacterium]
MRLKRKLILGGVIFVLGGIGCIFFSTVIHLALRGEDTVQLQSFEYCLNSLKESETHLMLFLLLLGGVGLASLALILTVQKPYQSREIKITPDITIPASAGQGQYGSARFMTNKEISKAFPRFELTPGNDTIKKLINNGKKLYKAVENGETPENNCEVKVPESFSVGGLVVNYEKLNDTEIISVISEDCHSQIIGATRCGKSRTLVIPSVCCIALAGEGLIINDPKGEIHAYTSRFLKSLGYAVHVLDFQNPPKSDCYNPLQPIIDAVNDRNIDLAQRSAWDLTCFLVERSSKTEPIWQNGEMSVMSAAILCVVYDNMDKPEYQNLTNVYWFIAEMCSDVLLHRKTIKPIVEYVKMLDDNHPAKPLLGISKVAPEKTAGSFYTSALATLRLFISNEIYGITKSTDFTVQSLSSQKSALFFILPDEKTTYYPIVTLIVAQIYERLISYARQLGNRLPSRVNFVLDEFGNFTAISDFEAKLTVGGGYGLRFHLFLQDFNQLKSKYSNEVAAIIRGNCQAWVYLQSSDTDTLKEIEKRLGEYTTTSYSLGSNSQKYSMPSSNQNVNLHGRSLLKAEEIGKINRPYQLVLTNNLPAVTTCPDLSEWNFNKMLGLGDRKHNEKFIMLHNLSRPEKLATEEIPLWGVWKNFSLDKYKNHN